ncbi:MAG: hypothetical protein ACREIC_29380, partial [Limisphaerales bacterium]
MNQLHIRPAPGIVRLLRLFALLTALLAAAITAHALDVDEIVARHTEALGGKASLSALHSMRLVVKISFGSGDSTIELAWT